jgi:hypothetical protein
MKTLKIKSIIQRIFLSLILIFIASKNCMSEESDLFVKFNNQFNQRKNTEESLKSLNGTIQEIQTIIENETSGISPKIQSALLLKSADIYLFLGDHANTNDLKRQYYSGGEKVALQGAKLIEKSRGVAISEDLNEQLAKLYYMASANMGRLGEIEGILTSINKWGTLKGLLETIIDMKQDHVYAYGPYRILGRAYFEIPFPIGSNQNSLNFLKKAFFKTFNPEFKISYFALLNIHYAQTLEATGSKDKAKQVLEQLIQIKDTNLVEKYIAPYVEKYQDNRITETLEEIEMAKKALEELK